MFQFAPPSIEPLSITPVVLVVLTGIIALIVEMVRPKSNNNLIVGVSLAGLVVAAVCLFAQLGQPDFETFGDMFVRDGFSTAMQLVLVVGTGLAILFSEPYLRQKRIPFGEFYSLVLWSTSGAMLMASSKNLLMIFLGLEILSVSLYVMAGMSRSEEKSEESALKYFLLGAFASGFFLYGIAFTYGASGSLHLDRIVATWIHHTPEAYGMLLIGLAFMLIGLGFKTSLFPFMQWTPDVYQGAPTNVSAFMATGSKIGAFAAMWRILEASGVGSPIWLPVLAVVAVCTMFYGNVVALLQKDVKRILAYSSISHAGYILVAVLAHAKDPQHVGFTTIVYYLLSYSFMTIGAFAIVSLTAKDGHEGTRLEDLNGLWQRSPLAAGALIVFVASLIGLPPTGGFLGKGLIFFDAIHAGLTPLAILLAVNSVISVYYYLAIARAALVPPSETATEEAAAFDLAPHDLAPERRPAPLNPAVASACVLCALGVIGAFVLYGPLSSFLFPR